MERANGGEISDGEVFSEYIMQGIHSKDGQFALRYGSGTSSIPVVVELSPEDIAKLRGDYLQHYPYLRGEQHGTHTDDPHHG